jgi:hypothetical protein
MDILCLRSDRPDIIVGNFYNGVCFKPGSHYQIQTGSESFETLPVVDFMGGWDVIPPESTYTAAMLLLRRMPLEDKLNLRQKLDSEIKEAQKSLFTQFELQRKALEARAKEIGVDFQSTVSYPK